MGWKDYSCVYMANKCADNFYLFELAMTLCV